MEAFIAVSGIVIVGVVIYYMSQQEKEVVALNEELKRSKGKL